MTKTKNKLIKKVLIANRGEIAVRIIRACRELNIKTVAVYSDADKTSLHTRLADESYHIGKPAASESYLNVNKLLSVLKKTGADAVHPGYGFLSENSSFIKTLEEKKINFIGPSSKSVEMMGNKTAARTLMQKNKVPIVPGTTDPVKSVKEGLKICSEIGYPVLLKAAAGGGGKGMRKVLSDDEFKSAFDSTRREADKAFADNSVYIEKFIEDPKHIEVQVIADKHGNYAHLLERECSVQRRHQKIIEEAPSPSVDETTRKKITKAAIDAAKACKYFNAGTIEFLMDKKKNFYFLEMNTRLQVEHPVTEFITGIDLVKEQIRIASGEKLSFKQNEININGHAVECRIYAEDPVNNFMPSSGKLEHYKQPSGPGVRLDSGFEESSEISVYYDPMISKLTTWGKDRNLAINTMLRALSEYKISGVIHNIDFLRAVLNHKEFLSGKYSINFIDKNFDDLVKTSDSKFKPDHLKEAAALFISLIREKKQNNVNRNNSTLINRWQEQMYE